jgi:hypothetical protein
MTEISKSKNNQKISLENKLTLTHEESIPEHQGVSEEKMMLNRELRDEMKRREQEQTHELLVGITNELFEKVEKLSAKEKSRAKKITREKSKSPKRDSSKKSKIEFTDLSWYREKLAASGEKNP